MNPHHTTPSGKLRARGLGLAVIELEHREVAQVVGVIRAPVRQLLAQDRGGTFEARGSRASLA